MAGETGDIEEEESAGLGATEVRVNVSFLSAGAGSCLSPRLTVTHCLVSLHRLTQMNTAHTQIRLPEHILSPVRHLVIFRISPVTHSESSLLLK